MTNLEQYIREFKTGWDVKDSRDYETTPDAIFLTAYYEAGTTYVDGCAESIIQKNGINPELLDTVKSLVYLSNRYAEKIEEEEKRSGIIEKGYSVEPEKWIKENGIAGYVDVILEGTSMIAHKVIKEIKKCRLKEWGGQLAVLAPHSRSRGYAFKSPNCYVVGIKRS